MHLLSLPCFLSPFPLPHYRLRLSHCSQLHRLPPSSKLITPLAIATSPPTPPPTTTTPPAAPSSSSTTPTLFACPRCRTPATPSTQRRCSTCSNRFHRTADYIDLTVEEPPVRNPIDLVTNASIDTPTRQQLFRSPLVSWLYERGWRAQFNISGFPGIEKEFRLVKEFFKGKGDVGNGGIVVDLSCGSGFMARRLAKNGLFSTVIATDYSENMLKETANRMRQQGVQFDIVRAAAECLPFCNNAVDFIHAGAAIHCWNRVQDGLREVVRVLKPGGRFFATTFVRDAFWAPVFPRQRNPFRHFDRQELVYLMNGAGFDSVDVELLRQCAIIRCEKVK